MIESPAIPPGQPATPEAYAGRVGRALDAVPVSPPDPRPPLGLATAAVSLPLPRPGAAPAPLRLLAGNLLHGLLPPRAEVAALRLGPLTLVAIPGEPVAEVGRRWRAAAGDGTEVLALAGDYLGYVETAEQLARGAGESMRTYYGPGLEERLADAVRTAAQAVSGPRPLAARP